MKILTVTNWSDLFQLKLQAESLSKHWAGNRRWTIVIEDRDSELALANLAWCRQNIQIDGWNIDFIIPDSSNYLHNGWERQQMFKLYYAATAEEDWTLILDAKNFLVKRTDESFFLRDNNSVVYLPRFVDNEFYHRTTEPAKQLLGITDDFPPSASITPWVFNKKEVFELIKLLGIDQEHWPVGKATEFTLYWHWVYRKFNWIPIQFVTGLWDGNYSCDKLNFNVPDEQGVSTNENIRFWTHHRYVTHPDLRMFTQRILSNAGLSKIVVEQWDKEFKTLLSKTKAINHQEFLKNRAGEDPGFDREWYK
jgi:hypothetical protein